MKHALERDGKDPSIIDLDPDRSLESQKDGNDPPLQDDPEYMKYFKMLKIGLPKEVVQHALLRDEKDISIVDLDPTKLYNAQTKKDLNN